MKDDKSAAFEIETERRRSQVFLDGFLRAYGLRKFKWSDRNILAVLEQGTASPEEVRRIRKLIVDDEGVLEGDVFDHRELWGRDRVPLVMVGHPYKLHAPGLSLLSEIVGLGLDVHVSGDSWYGHGTAHVRVSSPLLENYRL